MPVMRGKLEQDGRKVKIGVIAAQLHCFPLPAERCELSAAYDGTDLAGVMGEPGALCLCHTRPRAVPTQ